MALNTSISASLMEKIGSLYEGITLAVGIAIWDTCLERTNSSEYNGQERNLCAVTVSLVKLLSKNASDLDSFACRPQMNEENAGQENFIGADGKESRLCTESVRESVGASISFRLAVPFMIEIIKFNLRTISKRYSA